MPTSGDVVDLELGTPVASAAQCQHLRAASPRRIAGIRGNVGVAVLSQLRETIAVILDLP